MINVTSHLLLCKPIKFYKVCTIYPIQIDRILDIDENYYSNLFIPYIITDELLNEKTKEDGVFKSIFKDENLLYLLILSLIEFCKPNYLLIDDKKFEIFVGSDKMALTKDNFDEFSEIILKSSCRNKFAKETVIEPKFKTEEGRERWLKLQKERKNNKNNDNDLSYEKMINHIQCNGNFYVPESEILKWSVWKLTNTYINLSVNRDYNENYSAFLQCGDKKLIEKHWKDLIKPI